MDEKVYIIILNWNGWKDTIECIESLLKLKYKNFQIIIVDNNSSDNSLDYIKMYCKNNLFPLLLPDNPLKNMILPLFGKKIPYIFYSEEEVLKEIINIEAISDLNMTKGLKYPVIIIKNEQNYGFAKGNNTGLRYALKANDFSYIWLLNNDTIVEKDSLQSLVREIESNPKTGIVGSVIRYYSDPDRIQTIGGLKFFPFLGLAKLYCENAEVTVLNTLSKETILAHINYIMGASMLVRKKVFEDTGLLDEDYFFYAEDIDFNYRITRKGWGLSVSKESFIYHKASASLSEQKHLFFYFLSKNNIIFLKKQFGLKYNIIPFISPIFNILRLSRNPQKIKYALKGIIDGIKFKPHNHET